MTFLPIVARELRVAARRRGTYWWRSGAALTVLLGGSWLFWILQEVNRPPQEIAMYLFCASTGGAVLYGLLSGVWATADCLSEEKRQGTLGLLFLTDLRGYDVVLGKLVATSVGAFYGMAAVVPMLAVPMLMGGITPGEFGRMALVAVNAMFSSLAIGMGVSALSRVPQRAMALTFALLMLFALAFPALAGVLTMVGRTAATDFRLLFPSAGFGYYQALDLNYSTNPTAFWCSMAVIHGLGWLFLALASVAAPRAWQERPAGVQRLRWREQWRLWSYGTLDERAGFRRELLEENAFFWLAARARLQPVMVWSALGLVACAWVWGLARFRREMLSEWLYLGTGLFLNLLLRWWFAGQATRQLAEDRKVGALELLLSTPLKVREILHGQWLALRRQFLGPLAVVVAIEILFLFACRFNAELQEEKRAWVLAWLSILVILAADLVALYWVGLWEGLTARSPVRAVLRTATWVLIWPWVVIAVLLAVVAIMEWSKEQSQDPLTFFLKVWVSVSLIFDFAGALYARHMLLTHFRQAAEQRFEARRGFWRRWFGKETAPATSPAPAAPEAR